MSNKALKNFAKWGIIIVLIIHLTDNPSIAIPLLALIIIGHLALKAIKKPRRK